MPRYRSHLEASASARTSVNLFRSPFCLRICLHQKAERAREQEEAEARAQAANELEQRLQAEQQARAEAMAAKAKASAEARATAKAGAKADADAAKASRVAKAVGGGAKAAKYGEVQRVKKQAERIAERIAAGEDSPLCFYGGC